MSRVVDTYALQIVADDAPRDNVPITVWMPTYLAEAAENLEDLLPAGYSVRITRWDEPDIHMTEAELEELGYRQWLERQANRHE